MSHPFRVAESYAGLGRVQPLRRLDPAPEPVPKNWPARSGALLMVCGGRDYAHSAHVSGVLDELQPRAVVHGACGVDADRPRAAGVPVWKPAAPQPSAPPRWAGQPNREA